MSQLNSDASIRRDPRSRGNTPNDVRRAARRMVQEQLAKRTIARREEHMQRVAEDLVTQAAASVLAHVSTGLRFDVPDSLSFHKRAKSMAPIAVGKNNQGKSRKKTSRLNTGPGARVGQKRHRSALARISLLSMKEMLARLKQINSQSMWKEKVGYQRPLPHHSPLTAPDLCG